MTRLVILLSLLLAAGSALALDTVTRPVGPVHHWTETDLERFAPDWIHVKFVEGSDVKLAGDLFVDPSGLDLSRSTQALASADVRTMRRTFKGTRDDLRALKTAGQARSRSVGPDLSLWFDLQVAGGRAELARVINALNACPEVEICHPAPIVETAGIWTPSSRPAASVRGSASLQGMPLSGDRTPDFTSMQGYLYNAPYGLEAPSAWAHMGGQGHGMKFIDVELAWTADHEDFNDRFFFYEGGATQDPSYEPHGTAVLGEIMGQHNGYGVNGFAPGIRYGVVAVTVGEWPNVPHYFQEAIDQLEAGDAWLIELQMYPPGKDATPMEWLQVNYDVIWTGCWSLGIVCMEAGANGGQNLDAASWGGLFDRQVRDSGAIMVAAGRPNSLTAESFSNYGARMDAHAWGSQIVTTGYGDLYNGGTLQTRYTAGFGGTSGATPMVTGVALCLQGISLARGLGVMDPFTLRSLITDTGTPHTDPSREIGPRPNLTEAIAVLLTQSSVQENALASGMRILPNPTQGPGTVFFRLAEPGAARLEIFDLQGRLVRSLVEPGLPAGEAILEWDGLDQAGRGVRSGIYFLRLEGPGASAQGKLQVVR